MGISLACALLAAVAYGTGTVTQSVGVRRLTASAPDRRLFERAWAGRLYAVGLGLDAMGFVSSIVALRDLPLFLVEAAVASSVGVTAVAAFIVQGVRLQRRAALALAILLGGLILLAVSAEPGPAQGAPGGFGWLLLAGAALLALVVGGAATSSARRAGLVLATASGLGFGVVGIAARVVVVPDRWWQLASDPLVWALALAGVVSLIACGYALDKVSATTVAALIVASETVVPAAVGLAVLGDVVRSNLVPVAALGFVATIGGCLAVAGQAAPATAPGVSRPADRGSANVGD